MAPSGLRRTGLPSAEHRLTSRACAGKLCRHGGGRWTLHLAGPAPAQQARRTGRAAWSRWPHGAGRQLHVAEEAEGRLPAPRRRTAASAPCRNSVAREAGWLARAAGTGELIGHGLVLGSDGTTLHPPPVCRVLTIDSAPGQAALVGVLARLHPGASMSGVVVVAVASGGSAGPALAPFPPAAARWPSRSAGRRGSTARPRSYDGWAGFRTCCPSASPTTRPCEHSVERIGSEVGLIDVPVDVALTAIFARFRHVAPEELERSTEGLPPPLRPHCPCRARTDDEAQPRNRRAGELDPRRPRDSAPASPRRGPAVPASGAVACLAGIASPRNRDS